MDSGADRWRAVRGLLDDVIELPPPRREAVLARSGADAATLADVRELLAAADASGDFLDGEAPSAEVPDIAAYASLPIGTLIGAFAVERLVGRGGHGEVYRARRADGHFDQVVALKMLRPEAVELFRRFELERQILAKLDHPGIARLIDGGLAPDGRPYMAMEFVEGLDIDEHCRDLDLRARLAVFRQVCEAVTFAHRHLVIHRDLKPANVKVTPEGQVKLLDFGIARLVAAPDTAAAVTQAILTPAYAAPEQIEGALPTTATDVYGLGIVLCELLSGRNPWTNGQPSAAVMLRRLLDDEPLPPSKLAAAAPAPPIGPERLRGDLDAIVLKALRREPAQRYESAMALWDDIARHLSLRPVAARAGTRGYALRRFLRRNRSRIAAAAAVALALLGGTGGVVWQMGRTAVQKQAAVDEAQRADAARGQIMLLFRGSAGRAAAPADRPRAVLDRAAAALLADIDAGRSVDPLLPTVLAEFYAQLDDLKAAEPLLDRLRRMADKSGSPVDAARAEQGLAALRLNEGRLPEARDLVARARAVFARDPVRYGRDLIEARGIEAALLLESGRGDEAIALLRTLVPEADAVAGSGSSAGTLLLHNLGVHLIAAGRIEEAAAVFAQTWDRISAGGRELTPIGLSVQLNRAGIAARQGRLDEAEAGFRGALDKRLDLYGPSIATAYAQMNLARLLTRRGADEEALPLLGDALAQALAVGGETGPMTIGVRQSRAAALLALNRPAEAQVEIDRSLAAAETAFAQSPYVVISLALRARLLIVQARLDEAARDLAEADALAVRLGAPAASLRDEIAALGEQLAAARQVR